MAAIRGGEVDALVVHGPEGEQVFTLKGAGQPYRVMIERMNEGAVTVSSEGTLLYANRRFAQLVGMKLDKVIGHSLFDLIIAKDAAILQALLREARKSQSKCELTLNAPSQAMVQLSGTALQIDGVPAICIVVTDLTERRRSEEIAASENLARSILDQTAEAIVVCDPNGTIIRANNAAAMLAQQNPLLRLFPEVFQLFRAAHGSAREDQEPLSVLEPALKGETLRGIDAEFRRAQGEPIQLSLSAGPLSNPEGKVLGCVIALADVSERVRASQAAVALRDEFVSIASHELRTPLSALTLQIGNLQRLASDDPDGPIATKLQKAANQTRRLARLIDQLMDISRISSGHMALEIDHCDIANVVRESAERFAEEASRVGSELRIKLGSGVVGKWDSFRIEQVVTNLLSNAIRYGGGKPIEVELEADEEHARLYVRDNGIGIPAEDTQRIFQRFERSSASGRHTGLGLGLYISDQIVKAHGGRMMVESRTGEGSTFIVELRRAPSASSDEANSVGT
ncbi:PAS domain-containing sensor histidine kinase [Candidatus Binatus sp.]|uniref:sensor histidine kinase n=1 Tax=Candidatus Binatus sp. TaxID=2811406 RepID=UPI00272DB96C|nr:PAS domain-containing sensor histidine kinase [Candidatus Binatus sp.]